MRARRPTWVVMYANGRGVPQDDAEAVRWYPSRCGTGGCAAQGSLGGCTETDEVSPRTTQRQSGGTVSLRNRGMRVAQTNLGWMYAERTKCPPGRRRSRPVVPSRCGTGGCVRAGQPGLDVRQRTKCPPGRRRSSPVVPSRCRTGVCGRAAKFGCDGGVGVTSPSESALRGSLTGPLILHRPPPESPVGSPLLRPAAGSTVTVHRPFGAVTTKGKDADFPDLRQPPENWWFGTIAAVQFLIVMKGAGRRAPIAR